MLFGKGMTDDKTVARQKTLVQPSSCFVTIALDWLCFLAELVYPFTLERPLVVAGIIGAVFIACFGSVTLIQRLLGDDGWNTSLLKGFFLGIAAAVPYPVVGTFVGVILLATVRFRLKITVPPDR